MDTHTSPRPSIHDNSVLATIAPTGAGTYRHGWNLTREQATAYAASVDSPGMHRLVTIDAASEYHVDRLGILSAVVTLSTGDELVLDAGIGHDYVDVLLGETDNLLTVAAELAWLTLKNLRIAADGGGTLSYEVRPDIDDFTHEMNDMPVESVELTREGLEKFVDDTRTKKSLDDLFEVGMDDLKEANEDPDEAARDAYYRGIGIRR